jgi:hypothetical protein
MWATPFIDTLLKILLPHCIILGSKVVVIQIGGYSPFIQILQLSNST